MKFSFYQMIALVCILAVGLMTFTPFVFEDAEADDYTNHIVIHITRVTCANGVVHHYVSREMRDISIHIDNGSHQHSPPSVLAVFNNDEVCSVSGCYNCS